MNENEVTIKNGDDVITVNVDKLPEIITTQIDTISVLEKKIKACDDSANNAMNYVSEKMHRYEDKGKWIFKHRSGNTKDVIEDTQKAIDNLAEAQHVTVDALRQSFEFQRKLAEVSKYLFELGCANITVNRITVKAIEAKLKGASKKDISELARQEMLAVVKQLKEQEDILKKQEDLNAKVKSNFERLNEKDRIDAQQSQRLVELSALLGNKDSIDKRQDEAISGLKSELKEKSLLDNDQSKRIEKELKEIVNEKNGYLVNKGDYKTMAKIIQNCIQDDIRLKQLSENCKNTIKKRFDITKMQQKIDAVYKKIYKEGK